jgi:hypothetical protein
MGCSFVISKFWFKGCMKQTHKPTRKHLITIQTFVCASPQSSSSSSQSRSDSKASRLESAEAFALALAALAKMEGLRPNVEAPADAAAPPL